MGKVAEIKTKETTASVEAFINTIENETKRADSFTIMKLMQKLSKAEPKMWGGAIIGYGNKRYQSPTSGREVDWFYIGFSPRKANISLYLMLNAADRDSTLPQLGKYKTGGGCIYVNKLADIDMKVLEKLISLSLKSK